jgi:hypothetical protein
MGIVKDRSSAEGSALVEVQRLISGEEGSDVSEHAIAILFFQQSLHAFDDVGGLGYDFAG